MTGIFSLELDEKGLLTQNQRVVSQPSASFGSAGTMPTYDSKIIYIMQNKKILIVFLY